MGELKEYVNIFITLLAIVDPMGVMPVFMSLTADQGFEAQRRTGWIASLTVGVVLVGSILFGEILLGLLGVSMASFRIAGGILLLIMGIGMLNARPGYGARREETQEAAEKENVGVIPLAIPLLSGPGAISSMTIYAHRHAGWSHLGMLVLISLLVALITGVILSLARPICKAMGKTGVNITMRLMGLVLSAAAVQFIAEGLIQLFPFLSKI